MRFLTTLLTLFGTTLFAEPYLWVGNGGTTGEYANSVSVIDTATNSLVVNIPQAKGQFSNIWNLAFTPDGAYCYVSNGDGSNSISVIDTSNYSLVTTITNSYFNDNYVIALSPNGAYGYTANYGSYPYSVSVISTVTNSVFATILSNDSGTLNRPFPLALTPDGTALWVGNYVASGQIVFINTANNEISGQITAAFNDPYWISFLPNGSYAYIAGNASNAVYVVDTSDPSYMTTLSGFNSPTYIGIAPNGATAYVTNRLGSGTIGVIDTATLDTSTIPATGSDSRLEPAYSLAIAPNGETLYVPNSATSTINVVSTRASEVVSVISRAEGQLNTPYFALFQPKVSRAFQRPNRRR